jgi:hypothetical protein
MLRQLSLVSVLACLTAPQAIACSCSEEPQVAVASPVAVTGNEAPAAQPVAPAQPATAGAVSGKISFEGTPPEREKVDLSPEKVCKEHHGEAGMLNPIGVLVDGSGGLANVFVQITGVPETANKDGKDMKAVVLDQKDCDYKPHVFGILKKQPLEILNSDPVLHNIHSQPKTNKEFNLAMPDSTPRTQEFKKAEDAIRIKCDVHPWMAAFAFVMEHPYFAVTGADGSFSIDTTGLADGEYGIKVWQEVLGTSEGKVTVKDGSATFAHTFKK